MEQVKSLFEWILGWKKIRNIKELHIATLGIDWQFCSFIGLVIGWGSLAGRLAAERPEDVYIFHKRQLKEDFGHLYAKLGFTIQAAVFVFLFCHAS